MMGDCSSLKQAIDPVFIHNTHSLPKAPLPLQANLICGSTSLLLSKILLGQIAMHLLDLIEIFSNRACETLSDPDNLPY